MASSGPSILSGRGTGAAWRNFPARALGAFGADQGRTKPRGGPKTHNEKRFSRDPGHQRQDPKHPEMHRRCPSAGAVHLPACCCPRRGPVVSDRRLRSTPPIDVGIPHDLRNSGPRTVAPRPRVPSSRSLACPAPCSRRPRSGAGQGPRKVPRGPRRARRRGGRWAGRRSGPRPPTSPAARKGPRQSPLAVAARGKGRRRVECARPTPCPHRRRRRRRCAPALARERTRLARPAVTRGARSGSSHAAGVCGGRFRCKPQRPSGHQSTPPALAQPLRRDFMAPTETRA